MKTLNLAEARQNLSAIVDEVRLGGESVIISKYGHPAVMIVSLPRAAESPTESGVPAESAHDWRDKLGLRHPFRGQPFKIDPHFDDPMDDLWDVFDDTAEEPTP